MTRRIRHALQPAGCLMAAALVCAVAGLASAAEVSDESAERFAAEWQNDMAGTVRDVPPMAWLGPNSPAAGPEPREDRTYHQGETGERIVDFVKRVEARGFTGAVLAAKDGKVIAAVGAGYADLEETQPNTPATLFEIASATKPFTAAAVMRLVEDGQVTLDDSIAEHLPGVPENCRGITIEHLLRHTSGIPGTNSSGRGHDIERVLPTFLRGGPQHEPGTHWQYWNQGYAILSAIISRAAEMDYTAYCRQALFEPAGMRATRFTGDQAPEDATVAIGRSARGPARSSLEHPYGSYGYQYRGMGGVVTTVWDLWRWDRSLRDNRTLSAESKSRLFTPGLNDYAMGWFVRRDKNERLVQFHSGAVRGFLCDMRRYPEKDALLVVLCNRDDAPVQTIRRSLEAILFGAPSADHRPKLDAPLQSLEKAFAASITGRFQDRHGNVLVISTDDAVTHARIRWSPPDGPMTQAVLGRNDNGQLALYDGSDIINVDLDANDEPSAKRLVILGRTFERTAPDERNEQPRPDDRAKNDQPSGDDTTALINLPANCRLTEYDSTEISDGVEWVVLPRYQGTAPDGKGIEEDRFTLLIEGPQNVNEPDGQMQPIVLTSMNRNDGLRLADELAAILAKYTDEPKKDSTAGMDVTIYMHVYRLSKHRHIELSPTVQWRAQTHFVRTGDDGERIVDDRPTLVLRDRERRFWPVVVQMEGPMAQQLLRKMREVLKQQ